MTEVPREYGHRLRGDFHTKKMLFYWEECFDMNNATPIGIAGSGEDKRVIEEQNIGEVFLWLQLEG